MPANLTDTDNFDTAITPVGGDTRNAASVRDALQTLANRTRYLYNRLTPLADIAALKAVVTTGMANDTTRVVRALGTFHLDTASAAAEVTPFVVQPNVGPGRWIAASAHRTTRTVRLYPPQCLIQVVHDYTGNDLTSAYGVPEGVLSTFTMSADQKVALGFGFAFALAASASQRHMMLCALRVPDGVTITSVVATLVPAANGTLPAKMPWIDVMRTQTGATEAASLRSGGAVADPSGSVGAYYASHTITYTPNQNNVADHSLYAFEIAFAFGGSTYAVAGDILRHFDVTFTVPDARGE
jgi:hypothetical protein